MTIQDQALTLLDPADAGLVLAGAAANEDAPTLLHTADERYYVTETPTGLLFRDDTPLLVWGPLTARLIRAHKRLEFALADAINFGETRMAERYGEKYSHFIHETGRSYQGLRDIAWVGRQIEMSRRRDNLAFATQREIAPLPPAVQDTMLDLAVERGWSRQETREAVRVAKNEIKKAERSLLAPVEAPIPDCDIVVGDARHLPLTGDVADLICTSPPYALEKLYGAGGDVEAATWFDFIREVSAEAYRVTRVGGRFALNIPLDTSARPDPATGDLIPARPAYAQAVAAGMACGWRYRSTIIWHDDQLGKSIARGSVDSAASPAIITPVEMVILFYKGEGWGREDRGSDLAHQDWLTWTNGFWAFPGESQPWEDHPAPYPLELPRRLIHLLSFPGDLVVDPFVGSGTTALAAARSGRRFYGVDSEPSYVASALRRVARGVPR